MCTFRTFVLCSRSSCVDHIWRERRACGRISLHVRMKYPWCWFVHDMQLQSFGMVGSSSDRSEHHVYRGNSDLRRRADEGFVILGKAEYETTAKGETVPQRNWNKFSCHEMRWTNTVFCQFCLSPRIIISPLRLYLDAICCVSWSCDLIPLLPRTSRLRWRCTATQNVTSHS
jgi:hypothetical protein